ncbi:permease [Vibrio sp. 10N.286.55.E10]|uniref:MFS transporter n=1 Tax=Vibrio TaxID=662 RepID=UPI000C8561B9|nr:MULTISPECIES: MFS transporter [unclassified Vibrio]CAK3909859.1 MFS transporter [Vibrio crassostreae]PME27189.1 permease [Vibrio sp. 10N.286.55.E12]PME34089.1 permease [Vibrio sp. 10N.286.55.E10]PME63616.1 permease [Vibrio sp. 10N.286.55.C11]PMI18797.1 permease [Vibrio sp. 10N.286.46.E10]
MTVSVSTNPAEEKVGMAKWFPLLVLLAAQFSTMADNTGLSISTEALIALHGATMPQIQMANAMYPLIAGAGMIAGGLIGLIIGWKRQMIIGAGILSLASFAAAFAPNMEVLNYGARVGSGLGACLLIPAVLANVAGIYKGKDQAIAFSAIAALVGLASALTPLIFGFILDVASFGVAFAGLGVYCALVMFGSMKLPELPKATFKGKFDIVGVLLAGTGLLCFVTGLLKIAEWGLVAPLTDFTVAGISPALPMCLVGGILLKVLMVWERRFEAAGNTPLLPRSYVENPQVVVGLVLCATIFLLFGATGFINVSYMQLVAGMSAFASGMALCAFALGMMIGSLGAPAKLGNLSCQRICQLGFIIAALGTALMFLGFTKDGITFWQYISLLVFGIGAGLLASQASIVVTSALSEQEAMQSGGIQATSRNIGQAFGVAILGTVMLFSLTGEIKKGVMDHDAISAETKQMIVDTPSLPFVSNDMALELMVSAEVPAQEQHTVVAVMADSRLTSVQYALYTLIALMMGGLALCSKLPTRSLMANSD